jgi:hypothetical protein
MSAVVTPDPTASSARTPALAKPSSAASSNSDMNSTQTFKSEESKQSVMVRYLSTLVRSLLIKISKQENLALPKNSPIKREDSENGQDGRNRKRRKFMGKITIDLTEVEEEEERMRNAIALDD